MCENKFRIAKLLSYFNHDCRYKVRLILLIEQKLKRHINNRHVISFKAEMIEIYYLDYCNTEFNLSGYMLSLLLSLKK